MMEEPKIISEKEQEYSFTAFARMEDLLDKLKLLKYESEFLTGLKIKPIHKFYFMVIKNPGEQFYLFTILAAWLITKSGKHFDQPQEFDDPNDTITKILEVVKENGKTIDFSPNKLKQGVGEYVVFILDHLATMAINKNNIILQKPKPPEEKEEETEILEDESEINLDRVEEEMIAAYSDDSDEDIFHLDDLKFVKKEMYIPEIKSNIDGESWKLELERVLPRLKVTIKNENRDWRAHLEQMKSYRKNIDESLGITKTQLDKLQRDISAILEKAGNREKYFNRELDDTLEIYRRLQDELSKLKENYKNVNGGVAERNRELLKLTDRLETIKQQMEARGSSMTDGTPLVNIKKSVARVKAEIIDMDVRIGVLECVLLQTKIKEEKMIENEFGHSISVF